MYDWLNRVAAITAYHIKHENEVSTFSMPMLWMGDGNTGQLHMYQCKHPDVLRSRKQAIDDRKTYHHEHGIPCCRLQSDHLTFGFVGRSQKAQPYVALETQMRLTTKPINLMDTKSTMQNFSPAASLSLRGRMQLPTILQTNQRRK